MHAAKALYVNADVTVVSDGRDLTVPATPEHILTDMPVLLHTLARSAEASGLTEMSVLLGADVARHIGLPVNPPTRDTTRHPVLEAARQVGWKISDLAPWMSFRPQVPGRRATVHIGIAPWLHDKNFLLHNEDVGWTVSNLARFQALTGAAYRMKPGIAGLSMLEEQWRGAQPMWHPAWGTITPALDTKTETGYGPDWAPSQWEPRINDGLPAGTTLEHVRHHHLFDLHRQYLAAAVSSETAFGVLHRSPLKEFDRRNAGYWLVVVPAWNDGRLPHPMGPYKAIGTTAWCTTPTMALMEDLSNNGYMEMPDVLDSYVAGMGGEKKPFENTRRNLRAWGQALDRAATAALIPANPDWAGAHEQAALLEYAIKQCYKEAFGMMVNNTGRIWRPDWAHTVIATARTNMFRKMLTAAQLYDRWPARIHHDEITYASGFADSEIVTPPNFKIGESLGSFKTPTVIDTREAS